MKKILEELIQFCEDLEHDTMVNSATNIKAQNIRTKAIEFIEDLDYFAEQQKQEGIKRIDEAIRNDAEETFGSNVFIEVDNLPDAVDTTFKSAGELHDQIGMHDELYS